MHITTHAFWLQKAGNQREEYEDAFAYANSSESTFLCAVADGATETSFSGLWAHILVTAFIEKRLTGFNAENIGLLAQDWQAQIIELTRDRPLSWYAEEKLRSGAFSSFLGLQIDPGGTWKAVSIGDSCVFQIRESERLVSSPFDKPDQFNNQPMLISTNPIQNIAVKPLPVAGTWQDGDQFFLMTDALAQCYLANEYLTRRNFLRVTDQGFFEYLISRLRSMKACRNDDVTLVRVNIMSQENGVGMA
jgi:hypothetical protein